MSDSTVRHGRTRVLSGYPAMRRVADLAIGLRVRVGAR
jgi:hypothetical protein